MKNALSGHLRTGAFGFTLALVVMILALIPAPTCAREVTGRASLSSRKPQLQTSSGPARFECEAPAAPNPCEDDDASGDSDCAGPSVSPDLPAVRHTTAERPVEALDAPTPWIFERSPALRKRILKKPRTALPLEH